MKNIILWVLLFTFLEGKCQDIYLSIEDASKIHQVKSIVKKSIENPVCSECKEQLKEWITKEKDSFIGIIIMSDIYESKDSNLRDLYNQVNNNAYKGLIDLFFSNSSPTNYLEDIENLGQKHFLTNWWSHLSLIDNSNSVKLKTHIQRISDYKEKNTHLFNKDVSSENLFSTLRKWEKPYEYEAMILAISQKYNNEDDKGRTIMIRDLKKFIGENIPTHNPPKYSKQHTNLYIGGMISKIFNHQKLKPLFQELLKSKIGYNNRIARETLNWLSSGVALPFREYLILPHFNGKVTSENHHSCD